MQPTVKRQTDKGTGKTALLLGAGYCARQMIAPLIARGYRTVATTRVPDKQDALRALGAEPLIFDGVLTGLLRAALRQADILICSVPPVKNGDPFLNALHMGFETLAPQLSWVGYLSATSVYGDRAGQWAFEDEFLYPVTDRGRRRADAEMAWLETGWPVHIFRLAGIYGPGRTPFPRLRSGKARAVIKPNHVVNRIHVDDIVSALLASIVTPNPLRIYNLADGHPAPPQDVLDFAAELIHVPRPPRVDHKTANISDMARSFYTETKRISNARAITELGWTPNYPDYKSGLRAVLKAQIVKES